MDEQIAVASLAALAQGQRLRIYRALVGAAPEGMTPGMLAAMLDLPASTLSFHLKELLHSGLVTQDRAGRHLIYRSSIEQMNALMAYLSAHCCQSSECAPAPQRLQCAPGTSVPSRRIVARLLPRNEPGAGRR